ncbi:hypothetical protein ILYODFUR_029130 [Ilyodon furcidens]|uniref:Secreted protein n=1 Tax=Ilyodon furcidens TaxID=33524 RepID=A0ABV0V033_9TELE
MNCCVCVCVCVCVYGDARTHACEARYQSYYTQGSVQVLLRWIFWIQISVHVRVSPQLGGSDARSLHLMEAAEQNPERFLWTGTQSERDQNQQLYYSRTESFYATHAQIHADTLR